MTDTRAITCTLELHAYVSETAKELLALKLQLAEQERTIEGHVAHIIQLQRELAVLRAG